MNVFMDGDGPNGEFVIVAGLADDDSLAKLRGIVERLRSHQPRVVDVPTGQAIASGSGTKLTTICIIFPSASPAVHECVGNIFDRAKRSGVTCEHRGEIASRHVASMLSTH